MSEYEFSEKIELRPGIALIFHKSGYSGYIGSVSDHKTWAEEVRAADKEGLFILALTVADAYYRKKPTPPKQSGRVRLGTTSKRVRLGP